jgi:phosphoketolase
MLTLEMAIQKIQHFSPEQRNKVIEFIEFLEFQASQTKTIEQKKDDSNQEESFFEVAGIWEERNITLDDIRKDAWGKENQ